MLPQLQREVKIQRVRTEEAEIFLEHLGRGIPDPERLTLAFTKEAVPLLDPKTGRPDLRDWSPVPYRSGAYINANNNAYVCVMSSIQTPHPRTGRMRYWRDKASFGHGLALLVDDVGNGRGSKGNGSLETFNAILPPTAIVETSPDNFHLWYFLDRPEPSPARFQAFLYAFVRQVIAQRGGDTTVKDITRLGRLPTAYNNKRTEYPDGPYKYGEKPYPVHLAFADYSRRYSIKDICAAFDFNVVVPKPRAVVPVDEKEYAANYYLLLTAVEEICVGEGGRSRPYMNGSGKYRIQCPWGEEHSNGDRDGAYLFGPEAHGEHPFMFGCAHDTCQHERRKAEGKEPRGWGTFVDRIVMPYIEGQLEEAAQDEAVEKAFGARLGEQK